MIVKVLHAHDDVVEAHFFANVTRFSHRPVDLDDHAQTPSEFLGLYHDDERYGTALLTIHGLDPDPLFIVYVPRWAYIMDDSGRTIERL